jgi:hypothetical protein
MVFQRASFPAPTRCTIEERDDDATFTEGRGQARARGRRTRRTDEAAMSMAEALIVKIVAVILVMFIVGLVVWRRMRPKSPEANKDSEPPARKLTRSGEIESQRRRAQLEAQVELTPEQKAERTERKFRKALVAEAPDLAPSPLLRKMADSAAEAWIELKDVRRAADIYRDARLHERAVQLYLNDLQDPGAAARVVLSRRDFLKAGELFKQAGDTRGQCVCWLEWGKTAPDPLEREAAMREIGAELFGRLIAKIAEARPATTENVPLLQRLAGALDEQAQPHDVLAICQRLHQASPDADNSERIARLERHIAGESETDRFSSEFDGAVLALPALEAVPDSIPPGPIDLPRVDKPSRPIPAAKDDTGKTALAVVELEKRAARRENTVAEEQVARSRLDQR